MGESAAACTTPTSRRWTHVELAARKGRTSWYVDFLPPQASRPRHVGSPLHVYCTCSFQTSSSDTTKIITYVKSKNVK